MEIKVSINPVYIECPAPLSVHLYSSYAKLYPLTNRDPGLNDLSVFLAFRNGEIIRMKFNVVPQHCVPLR